MSQSTRLSLLDEIRQTTSSDRWNEFLVDYSPILRRWMRSHNLEESEIEDIHQEAMLAIVEEIPNFNHNGRAGAFRNWLRQIVVNRMRRVWEKKSREGAQSNLQGFANALADENSHLAQEWQREYEQHVITTLLARAGKHFSEDRIEMFRELVLDEQPVEIVAGKRGMTTGAVRVQQHRILAWFRTVGREMIEL